jgi:major vault protein
MADKDYQDELDSRPLRPGQRRTTNELVLPRGEFLYTRDTTSGITCVRCGPAVVNAQAQDEPVIYDDTKGRFAAVPLSEAAQVNTVIPTGHYAVMNNPNAEGKYPEVGNKSVDTDLLIGQRVHIPGPANFALWPRQHVKVIAGHQLRSNQYLTVRVYDETAARTNWTAAVMKKTGASKAGETEKDVVTETVPKDLSVGRLLVIRGTEVSFYIPPTGIEVVPNEKGQYVREALTLERLQYCILIDENGNKRYVRGPSVVFPLPTEVFYTNSDNERTFRPVELNGSIQGLHIKVIAAYVDTNGDHGPKGKEYKEGDELFITGETTPIYFPCEQHSAIHYDGKTKHFATAIPAGDARYVLNRQSGAIKMLQGGGDGTMYLPDPRTEVFVRRVLSDSESETMYPENKDAVDYNRTLRAIQARSPSTRKGVVSEGDLEHAKIGTRSRTTGLAMNMAGAAFADVSLSAQHTNAEMGGDDFTRSASYSEPRTVTIGNDKFAGVPKINPWTGYAVMVVDTAGNRRVVKGPQRVLLGFNETLETLALSTMTPKTTDRLFKTAYLQVDHNKVTDIIVADTADHVKVELKVALKVNFEGKDQAKWFSVPNYVKLLCDHVRSLVKANVRKVKIEDFWASSEGFVRDTILGVKPADGGQRPGLAFAENGMRVYDVEVLMVKIGDATIQKLLESAQHEAVQSGIDLARTERKLHSTKQIEELLREELKAKSETSDFQADLTVKSVTRELEIELARFRSAAERSEKELEQVKQNNAVESERTAAEIDRLRAKANNDLEITKAKETVRLDGLAKETEATVKQLTAAAPGFTEALLALGNQDTLVKVAEAMSVQRFVGGKDLPEVIQKVFAGTPLEKIATTMLERSAPAPKLPNGNGTHKPGNA